ncbi:MAG TPA: tyrosine-type recombinase/integrase [Gemmatimonadales bacterium]|nr:tyrosine-type recombinase/integrase [Gemmatimonadales bacterium]
MLSEIVPKKFPRIVALPVLGQVADDYDTWLAQQGYGRDARCEHARALVRIDRDLQRRGHRQWQSVRQADLEACLRRYPPRDAYPTAAVRGLLRFAEQRSLLPARPPAVTRVAMLSKIYGAALDDLRGLAPLTIREHVTTAAQFLSHLDYQIRPERLAALTASDVEAFVRTAGQRLSRATLQHRVAQLRGFLRFLASNGRIPPGLDREIDTPRVYRQEQLPRSLPWSTVRSLLHSIDRRTPQGLRDYTMLFLIATYGLRACQVVALTLDAVDWRGRRLHVPQRKAGAPLVLPLTDAAGTVLLRYLRRGRPSSPYRELFLRQRAPAGILKPTAVSDVFQKWVRRSGLPIPFHGAHCLRHSYAVALLRRGVGLKTLGDLLGHRTAESTCAYLRLATDDLREVALSVPRVAASRGRR